MNMHISSLVTWRCFHSEWASNWKAEGPRRRQSSLLAAVRAARALHTIKHAASRCSLIWLPAACLSVSSVSLCVSSVLPPSRPVRRINAPQLNSAFASPLVAHFRFFKATLEAAYKMKETSPNCTTAE